jgi:hypothetical protein
MPVLEDIIFRALALAVAGAEETGEAGGLVIAGPGSDSSCAIADPANHPFRDCLAAREAGGDAPFESAAWVLTSLAAFGITNATPRLDGGRSLAFAIGAADHTGSANLTVAYDSATWNESSAARLLARARDILEAPYAMLV